MASLREVRAEATSCLGEFAGGKRHSTRMRDGRRKRYIRYGKMSFFQKYHHALSSTASRSPLPEGAHGSVRAA